MLEVSGADILDEVEDSHSVADGREEVRAIGTENQVALRVDSPQQIRKLWEYTVSTATRTVAAQAGKLP